MNIIKFVLVSLVLIFSFINIHFVYSGNIFSTDNNDIIYCQGNDCSLQKGIDSIKGGVKDIDTERSASEMAMDIVRYLLTFISIIAIVYIIYAGFRILTSAGDEETNKNSKKIIVSVAIGVTVMWLAYSIIDFVLRVLTSTQQS